MERRSADPSMSQALHLMNSDTIRSKVEAADNILGKLLAEGKPDSEVIDALFQRAYAPPPDGQSARTECDLHRRRAGSRPHPPPSA